MTNRCTARLLPAAGVMFLAIASESLAGPVIDGITPQSGAAGSRVTIVGRGFSADNTIGFGSILIRHVRIASAIAISCTADPKCKPGIRQSLDFSIPRKIRNGSYGISVRNDSGASNVMSFTVTAK